MSKSYKNIGCENLYLRYFNHKDTKYLLLIHHLDVAPNESKSTLDIFWKLKIENLVLSTNTILGNYICKKVDIFGYLFHSQQRQRRGSSNAKSLRQNFSEKESQCHFLANICFPQKTLFPSHGHPIAVPVLYHQILWKVFLVVFLLSQFLVNLNLNKLFAIAWWHFFSMPTNKIANTISKGVFTISIEMEITSLRCATSSSCSRKEGYFLVKKQYLEFSAYQVDGKCAFSYFWTVL